ncbi:MAG: Rieske (2Fe-2S) protein [Thermoguttaceae bacterium]|jgi:Rieske Fe-S protein
MFPTSPTPGGSDRRNFLAAAAALICAAVAYAVPALTGLVAFLSPWRQKAQPRQLIRVAALSALPLNGPPQKFPVIADRTDAWNRFAAEPIGAVYLRRTGEQAVAALQVLCPHAGCFVSFDDAKGEFFCPCHGAQFSPDGARKGGASCLSPRDLDTLVVEIRNGSEVWVEFAKFQTGTAQKSPQA